MANAPSGRAAPLPREPLRRLVDQLGGVPLTTVVAPAGSGKTTLLSYWRDVLVGRGEPVAWLDLSAVHADVSLFAFDLLEDALSRAPGFGAETRLALTNASADDADWRLVLRAFRRDARPGSLEVVLLDNYHELPPDSATEQFVCELLRTSAEPLHVVIASRGRLPASAARLRLADAVLELGPSDLNLRFDEARGLLAERDVAVDDALLRQLLSETAGWVTGIQLAGQALARLPAPERVEYVGELARHPDLFAYIAGEVLRNQPEELVSLLEHAALLGRCTPGDLAHMLDDPAAIEAARAARDRGLLLGTDAEVWPHPLWRALLREQLHSRLGEAEWRIAKQRAAETLARSGRTEDALAIYAEIEDWDAAAVLLASVAQAWGHSGRSQRVLTWIGRLPSAAVEEQPELLAALGVARLRGDPAQAEALLERASQLYEERGELGVAAPLHVLRAFTLYADGRQRELRALIRKVLAPRSLLRATATRGDLLTAVAGWANITGRYDRAIGLSERALRQPISAGLRWANAVNLTMALALQGRFAEAERAGQQALDDPSVRAVPFMVYSLLASHGLVRGLGGDVLGGLPEVERAAEGLADFRSRRQRENALRSLALLQYLAGQHDASRSLLEALREDCAKAHDDEGEGSTLVQLALQEFVSGEPAAAHELARRSADLLEGVVSRERHAWPWNFLRALWLLARDGDAEASWQRARPYHRRLFNRSAPLVHHTSRLFTSEIARLADREGEARALAIRGWQVAADAELRMSDPIVGNLLSEATAAAALRDERVAPFVLERLRQQCPSALPGMLTDLAGDRTATLRERAVRWMGEVGGRDLHDSVVNATRDRVARVREAAREVLPTLDLQPRHRLFVRSLGSFAVSLGSGPQAETDWAGGRPRRLFGRLLVARGRPVQRDVLICDLWPDADDAAGRNNLRVALSQLNAALDPERPSGAPSFFIEAEHDALCLRADGIAHWDAGRFDELSEAGRQAERDGEVDAAIRHYREAVEEYDGPLLPELVYEEWSAALREQLAERMLEVGVRLGELLLASEDHEGALDLARRLLAEDPTFEPAAAIAMRAHLASRESGAALRVYRRCDRALQHELEIGPGTVLQRLAALARAADSDASAMTPRDGGA